MSRPSAVAAANWVRCSQVLPPNGRRLPAPDRTEVNRTMKVGASDRGFAATSPKSKPSFKEWCRPMLGMGGAARPHYIARCRCSASRPYLAGASEQFGGRRPSGPAYGRAGGLCAHPALGDTTPVRNVCTTNTAAFLAPIHPSGAAGAPPSRPPTARGAGPGEIDGRVQQTQSDATMLGRETKPVPPTRVCQQPAHCRVPRQCERSPAPRRRPERHQAGFKDELVRSAAPVPSVKRLPEHVADPR